MTEVVLAKQQIEPGMTERLRELTDEICDREDEAIGARENEGMRLEAAFVEWTDEGAFRATS